MLGSQAAMHTSQTNLGSERRSKSRTRNYQRESGNTATSRESKVCRTHLRRDIAAQVRIGVLGPCASNIVALLEDSEILTVELPFQLHTHANAGQASADDSDKTVGHRVQIAGVVRLGAA